MVDVQFRKKSDLSDGGLLSRDISSQSALPDAPEVRRIAGARRVVVVESSLFRTQPGADSHYLLRPGVNTEDGSGDSSGLGWQRRDPRLALELLPGVPEPFCRSPDIATAVGDDVGSGANQPHGLAVSSFDVYTCSDHRRLPGGSPIPVNGVPGGMEGQSCALVHRVVSGRVCINPAHDEHQAQTTGSFCTRL